MILRPNRFDAKNSTVLTINKYYYYFYLQSFLKIVTIFIYVYLNYVFSKKNNYFKPI